MRKIIRMIGLHSLSTVSAVNISGLLSAGLFSVHLSSALFKQQSAFSVFFIVKQK